MRLRTRSGFDDKTIMIRLISTDFDGTLIWHEHEPAVSPELFDLFSDLRKNGAVWAINTGRAVHHIVEGIEEFEFPIRPDYIITSERDVFRRKPDGKGWEDFGDWNSRCLRAHDELFRQAKPILEEINLYIKNNTKALPINDIAGTGLVASSEEEMEEIAGFIDSLRPRLPTFHYQRNTRYMRFCHSDYSKGTALGELGRLLGIPKNEIFAVGDHYNDIPMLDGQFASQPACPSNAADAVKQTVLDANGYVANQPCSDGVVEAIHYFSKS